jgi:hypothetical protein
VSLRGKVKPLDTCLTTSKILTYGSLVWVRIKNS